MRDTSGLTPAAARKRQRRLGEPRCPRSEPLYSAMEVPALLVRGRDETIPVDRAHRATTHSQLGIDKLVQPARVREPDRRTHRDDPHVGDRQGYGRLGESEVATDASGMLPMGARLFNAVTGQFTSQDPPTAKAIDPGPRGAATPAHPREREDCDRQVDGRLQPTGEAPRRRPRRAPPHPSRQATNG